MILEYSITNTFSIKETQTISFEADETIEDGTCDHILECCGKKILKLACIYGPNASGKTKIAEALDFYINFIVHSFLKMDSGETTGFEPFAFDPDTKRQPGEFRIVFFAKDVLSENLIRYEYSLQLNKESVVLEELYYAPKGQKRLVFSRSQDKTIKWGSSITGPKSSVEKILPLNCSVISTGARVGMSICNRVYTHFKERYSGLSRFADSIPSPTTAKRLNSDPVLKGQVARILSYADFGNISDIDIEEDDFLSKAVGEYFKEDVLKKDLSFEKLNEFYRYRVSGMTHSYKISDHIPLHRESAGTQHLMEISLPLIDLIKTPQLRLIDEIESSLHQDVLEMWIRLFLELSEGSQILFTTHNQDLLDSELLRDDEVWFCSKYADGGSHYNSIVDYTGVKKDVSRRKLYKAGKFESRPFVDYDQIKELIRGS